MKNRLKFKKRNNRYCCDVDSCDNYAYAEMYRTSKHAWMYMCKKHYKLKLKNWKPIEKDIGFYILDKQKK